MKRSAWADSWYQQALHDLAAARALREDGFYDTCALMCQQAAEKAVKALWIDMKQCDPPRVHWVERLAADLGAPQDVRDAGTTLVADYMSSRYPQQSARSPFSAYLLEDADDRVEKAEFLLGWVGGHWT